MADCAMCQDTGLFYWENRYSFCKCPAGIARQEREPECVNEANQIAERLEAIGKGPCGPRR